jgi:hypothetical protein
MPMRIGTSSSRGALLYPAALRAAVLGRLGETSAMMDDRFGGSRGGRRLRALCADELVDGEHLVAWTQAWVSRDGKYNVLFAARHPDFVVLTTRRLLLWSCGFFSRMPRRKVFDERREGLAVEPIGARRARSVRVEAVKRRPLRLDLRSDPPSDEIAGSLLARPQRETTEQH